jgi:hypothetical protein
MHLLSAYLLSLAVVSTNSFLISSHGISEAGYSTYTNTVFYLENSIVQNLIM